MMLIMKPHIRSEKRTYTVLRAFGARPVSGTGHSNFPVKVVDPIFHQRILNLILILLELESQLTGSPLTLFCYHSSYLTSDLVG